MGERVDLSSLPRIDDLVAAAAPLRARFGDRAVTDALRRAVDEARGAALDGAAVPGSQTLLERAEADLRARRPGPPRRVVNATGVVLHTNLGRAPLSEEAVRAAVAAAGYCDLEFDLATGGRGSRTARLEPLLVDATGAAAATVVNNAAAALVLALATLAAGRDVLVSRGELVEIGGSFRLPEIMAASGARLVEVGTTNRTRAQDYADAGDDVAAILRVHPSNYRIVGFTERPGLRELVAVARARGVPLVHDVGSGLLAPSDDPALADEPSLRASVEAGADLVLCSGDKLLGGPQAGLLLGREELVRACARHPLARALRLDKLRVAALAATLEAHLRGQAESVPTWRMLRADGDGLRRRCSALAEEIGGTVAEDAGLVGGGAAPEGAVPGPVVRLPLDAPTRAVRRLRDGDPPVVVRVVDGALLVDLRTVDPPDDALLARRLAEL